MSADVPDSPSPPAPAPRWSGPADLTNCDREPVQFPGAIMPHGALLLIDPADGRIQGASANTDGVFGVAAESLLGAGIEAVFDAGEARCLANGLARLMPSATPSYLGCHRPRIGATRFDSFAHLAGGRLILEVEPIPDEQHLRSPTEIFAEVAEAVPALRRAEGWVECLTIATAELKRLSGYAATHGARFIEDGSAQAVAEARDEAAYPSYLDMRFPRSDIPEPARRQMILLPVQYAPDLDYVPVPLLLADGSDPAAVDLGLAVLRSVSPMCSRFYLNMGTRSRLVLSLLEGGRLWGFLSGWGPAPHRLTFTERLALGSFAALAGPLVIDKYKAEIAGETRARRRRVAAVAATLETPKGLAEGLAAVPERLLGALDLGGVVVCMDGRVRAAGEAPPVEWLRALAPWLDRQPQPVVTDRLPALLAADAEAPALVPDTRAIGLVALALLDPGQHLLALRPEWAREVRWAGRPEKPVAVDPVSGEWRLTPRGSFAVWQEDVRGLARPWLDAEIEALVDLQRSIVLAQYADRQRLLAEMLARSNADLESFAYVVSHDLQEPLRGIRTFSQMLREGLGDQLSGEPLRWHETVTKLAVRMSEQIDALLQYSRAGQQPLEVREVALGELLASVLDALSVRIAQSGARVDIAPDLPRLPCDPIRTAAVFENLIGNAIKYNEAAEKRVEVGWLAGEPPTFFVRDNGIGIAERHHEAIFTIFRRLHGRDKFGGGTGAGLTIARKHVRRQGGRLWVESAPGQGSTFYFTLGPAADERVGD